jgi:hypothetical protein
MRIHAPDHEHCVVMDRVADLWIATMQTAPRPSLMELFKLLSQG